MSSSLRNIDTSRDDDNVGRVPESRSPRLIPQSALLRLSPRARVTDRDDDLNGRISPSPSSGTEDVDSSPSDDSATVPTRSTNNVKKQDVSAKPDIRLWLLQNQLSTLREEVHNYHLSLQTSLQDMKEELKQENEIFDVKVSRNESAWNNQFSHLTRHIQQQIVEVKKYIHDDVVKNQLKELEVAITDKVQIEHILPVQMKYIEIEGLLQKQSQELKETTELQQTSMKSLEKNVNIRKLIVDSLEKQVQSVHAEFQALQQEWKDATSKIEESSAALGDRVEHLSTQWTDQQQTLLSKMEKHEDEILMWGATMKQRTEEHENLQAQLMGQEKLIHDLQGEVKLVENLDKSNKHISASLTEHAMELAATKEELKISRQELKAYQSEREKEQNELDQELDERHEMFTQLQATVEQQAQELRAVRAELEAGRIEREEVQKEIAKNMEMQNTLFDYLVKQVQNQSNDIKLAHTNLATFQHQYTAITADLEKKIETRKVLTDRMAQTLKQHGSDLQAAQSERDAMRRSISNNMDVCTAQDEILKEKMAEHEKNVAAALKINDEVHEKLVSSVAPQTEALLRQLKLQDEDLQALKAKNQTLDETVAESMKALSARMETLGMAVKEQDSKLLEETKDLSSQVADVKKVVQEETNKLRGDQSKLKESVEKHTEDIDGLQMKVNEKAGLADTLQTFMSVTQKEIQALNDSREEDVKNLSNEIESRNIQAEQMVDRMKQNDDRIESVSKRISSVKKELEQKVNVQDVLFDSLIRQVQHQGEEMKKRHAEANGAHSDLRQNIATCADQLEKLEGVVNGQGQDLQHMINGEVNTINGKLQTQEEAHQRDKQEQAELWIALDKTLDLNRKKFDDVDVKLQTHEADLGQTKQEVQEAIRKVEMALEAKAANFDEIREQLISFGEVLQTEKDDRTRTEAEMRKALVHERFFRSELVQSVESKLSDLKEEVQKLDEEILMKTREERDGELDVVYKKLVSHDNEFKEIHLEILDSVEGLQKVESDTAEVKTFTMKLHANFEETKKQLQTKITTATERVEAVVVQQTVHSFDHKSLRDQMDSEIAVVEAKISRMEGFIQNLRATLAGIVRVDSGTIIEDSRSPRSRVEKSTLNDFMREVTKQIEDIKKTTSVGQEMKPTDTKDDWSERLEQLEQRLQQQEVELSSSKEMREAIENELQEKSQSLKVVEQQLVQTSEILKETKWENRGLRVTLSGLHEHHKLLKKTSSDEAVESKFKKAADSEVPEVDVDLTKNFETTDSFQTANLTKNFETTDSFQTATGEEESEK